MGLPYACNTPLTFLYKNYTHQYINTCHGSVTHGAVLTVCYPAEADIHCYLMTNSLWQTGVHYFSWWIPWN